MSRAAKFGIIVTVVVVGIAGMAFMGAAKRKNRPVDVKMEQVGRRDLVSAVTASGTIEAKTSVDISADITGRIIRLGVREGDRVTKGQFLVQIDPAQYQAAVARAEAMVSSSQASMIQAKANRDQAERALARARELSKSAGNLISAESVEQAQTSFDVAVATYNSARAQVEQAQAGLQEARDNLSKTRIISPIDGRVVRLAVEEGEVAVPGTFSREVGLLLTVADMSVIQANVKVDETDVVRLEAGDSVEITIDAFPDTAFVGRVTKISNSAQLTATATAGGSQDRAVDFDVEITLTAPPAEIRPDLSATARIVTETRSKTLSVPIIALTVRDYEKLPNEVTGGRVPEQRADSAAKKAKRDVEGVFVVKDGVAMFRPVKVGIAGDEHFEVLDGVREGETIVAGPYQAIRDLSDSTRVRASEVPAGGEKQS
jgi:HlyD family secretion protein